MTTAPRRDQDRAQNQEADRARLGNGHDDIIQVTGSGRVTSEKLADIHSRNQDDAAECEPACSTCIVVQVSLIHKHRLMIKCVIPKSNAVMPTSVAVHRAAQWHERECAEMFGITFEGHPDPRNILLPDDWVGWPLRKDYEFPEEYHGISCK